MEVPLNESVIISRAGVSLMQRVIGEGTTLAIGEDRAWVVLRGERTSVYSRLIDETYPNYESVIPDNNDKTLRVTREEMVGATKRTGIYSSSMTNQIRLTLHPDRLTLDAEDVERSSEAEEKVFCEFDGEEEMEIGFNAEYLETVLSKTVAEEVKMKLSSPNRAGLVRPVGDEDHLMLLMPVMINGHG
jgi:DNA polymerase-3 subunit beta